MSMPTNKNIKAVSYNGTNIPLVSCVVTGTVTAGSSDSTTLTISAAVGKDNIAVIKKTGNPSYKYAGAVTVISGTCKNVHAAGTTNIYNISDSDTASGWDKSTGVLTTSSTQKFTANAVFYYIAW